MPAVLVFPFEPDTFEEMFYNYQTVAAALIVFGVAFLIIESAHKGKTAKINSNGDNLCPGFCDWHFSGDRRGFPGDILFRRHNCGALLGRVSRTAAAEFTFFLAIPAMFGACFLMEAFKFGFSFTSVGDCPFAGGNGYALCRFHSGYPIP